MSKKRRLRVHSPEPLGISDRKLKANKEWEESGEGYIGGDGVEHSRLTVPQNT